MTKNFCRRGNVVRFYLLDVFFTLSSESCQKSLYILKPHSGIQKFRTPQYEPFGRRKQGTSKQGEFVLAYFANCRDLKFRPFPLNLFLYLLTILLQLFHYLTPQLAIQPPHSLVPAYAQLNNIKATDIKVIHVSIRSAIWAENGWIEHNNSQRLPAKGKLKAFPRMSKTFTK